ncbi:MAG: hypothetical protein KDC98_07180 [Planctomycetes bacterium]|nr:hypothetical protein [Planctomycetota bacterium]
MKKLLTFVLATALCTPAFAQKTGSSNRGAPEVKQSVKSGGQTFDLDYTSITWARGSTMESAMDKENGGDTRARINGAATKMPIGSFKNSAACKCGDLELPAGEYKVYYTINDDCEWQINFQSGDHKAKTMKLPLMDNHEASKRLMMCLFAGDDAGAGVYIAFGMKFCVLTFEPMADKKDK